MNEKRSLQDLIDQLAEKHKLSKKDAEAVVKGIFDLIEEALDRDKYVKVKGLGTFKLTEVESRESVDVNTGERIEIQGHNKVSYTPDTSMKDLINKPFAHFETVILNEGIQLEDTVTETEEELAEELRTENDADATGQEMAPLVSPETVSLSVSSESPTKMSATQSKELKTQDNSEPSVPVESVDDDPIKKTETEVASLTIVARKVEITSEKVTTNCMMMDDPITPRQETGSENKIFQQKEDKTPEWTNSSEELVAYRRWIMILVVLLLLSVSVGAYFFFQNQRGHHASNEIKNLDTVSASIGSMMDQPLDKEPPIADSELNETMEPVLSCLPETSSEISEKREYPTQQSRPATVKDTLEYDITGTIETHTLKDGESLIKIALKYYGNKELWPYIVKHNINVIRDANRVPVGSQLRIPQLTLRK